MNTWIFQANPKYFDIDRCLQLRKNISWSIRQKHFIDEIIIGDSVYIWRSKSNHLESSGIIAKGIIVQSPLFIRSREEEPYPDDEFNIEWPKERIFPDIVCTIKISEIRLSEKMGMVTREELKRNIHTKDIRIIKIPMETNYKLEKDVTAIINELWSLKKD